MFSLPEEKTLLKGAFKTLVIFALIPFLQSNLLADAAENRYSDLDKLNARQLWAAAVKKGDYVRVVQKEVCLPPETSEKVREFLLSTIEFEFSKDDWPAGFADYLPRAVEILSDVARSSKRELSQMEIQQIWSRYYLLAKEVARTYMEYRASLWESKYRWLTYRGRLVQFAGEKSVRRLDAAAWPIARPK